MVTGFDSLAFHQYSRMAEWSNADACKAFCFLGSNPSPTSRLSRQDRATIIGRAAATIDPTLALKRQPECVPELDPRPYAGHQVGG